MVLIADPVVSSDESMSKLSMLEYKVVPENHMSSDADIEAIQHLKEAIRSGKHWYIALLEAIGLWGSTEEVYDGQDYHYLVGNEAFDWLLLAERLCYEIDDSLSGEEKINLLFFAIPPIELSQEEFRNLIGSTKYRSHLNYMYGVVVEEALLSAVEEEVYRERKNFTTCQDEYVQQEACRRVYGADMNTLLPRFREEKGYPSRDSITLTEKREFTFWLFKHRVDSCDKERVASDTKKALCWLHRQWACRRKRAPARAAQAV